MNALRVRRREQEAHRATLGHTEKGRAIDLPGVDPHHLVRSLAQAFVDNRKTKRPLSALVAALPADPTTRVTTLKTAESILRAGFAGRS